MGELPGGKDLLGLPPGEVLERSGGPKDPEETRQDKGEAVCEDWDLFLHRKVKSLAMATLLGCKANIL